MPARDVEPILNEFYRFHKPILTMVSSVPPMFVGHDAGGHAACFSQGVAGIADFRYDFQIPKVTKEHVGRFRTETLEALHRTTSWAVDSVPELAMSPRPARVLLLQRSKGGPRWITNMGDLEKALESSAHIDAKVRYMERLPLLEQIAVASSSDVLVGAHGAGLAWLVVMPRGSAIVEAMPSPLPSWLICIGRWDNVRNIRDTIYGGLAHLSGQHHICLAGGNDSVSGNACYGASVGASCEDGARGGASLFRYADIRLSIEAFLQTISEAVDMLPFPRIGHSVKKTAHDVRASDVAAGQT